MKTLHQIVSQIAKGETVQRTGLTRREIAKIRAEVRRPLHPTVTTNLMNTRRINTGNKCYWPTRYSAPTPEQERTERDVRLLEHSFIEQRRKFFPQYR